MNKRLISALLLLTLSITSLPLTALAKKGGSTSNVDEQVPQMNISSRDVLPKSAQTVTITTEADFLAFADACHLDDYSTDKLAVLTNDITLTGTFDGIPIFAGTFDGCGHTIDGLSINTEDSYAGLFSQIQPTGVVKNLNVKGDVNPEETTVNIGGIAGLNSGLILNCTFDGIVSGTDYVGGIAGVNELSGIIADTGCSGMVSGTHFIGGIAGTNHGSIARCTNESMVNIVNKDADISFENVDRFKIAVQGIKDLLKKNKGSDDEAAQDETVSDIGGIAGISGGVITSCVNNGDIGYEHVGFNIGGIAGRQTGFIDGCTNNGTICGRKDVGGIVGQAEPYIAVDLTEDTIEKLRDEIENLNDDIDVTLNDAKHSSDVVSDRLSVISDITGRSLDDVRYLTDGTIDFVNDASDSASRAVRRIDSIIDAAGSNGGFMDETKSAASALRDAMNGLHTAVGDADVRKYMSEEDKAIYDAAKASLNTAIAENEGYYNEMYKTAYNDEIDKLRNAATDPKYTGLVYYVNDTPYTGTWSVNTPISGPTDGTWKHADGSAFPNTADADEVKLNEAAKKVAERLAKAYAIAHYDSVHGAFGSYVRDTTDQVAIMTATTTKYMDQMSEQERKDAAAAINSARSASDHLQSASSQLKTTMRNLSDNNSNSDFPTLSSDYKSHADSLTDKLSEMNDNFSFLNDELHGSSDSLIDDVRVINDRFRSIMDLFTDAIDDLKDDGDEDIFNDKSLDEAEKSTDAVVASCTNYGWVYGDVDSGGIAGTMAVENDFDKEGKISGADNDDRINTTFLTKCILRDNSNYGIVRGDKDYAGGITGLQETGAVLRGNNYADIRSNNGSYVGGIAGSSLSYVLRSNSEGVLSGEGYVGGIVGNGVKIQDCYSLVQITDTSRWYGAIAGHIVDDDDTEVKNNYYTSDTLFGINKVSYTGKASPVAYEDRKDVLASIPDEFEYLTLTYLLQPEVDEEASTDGDDADDDDDDAVVLARSRVPYGRRITASDYPEADPPEGCYVSWDITGVDEVLTDQTITASYKRYRTSIAGDDNGKEHHSDLLVDGLFREGDKLTVNRSSTMSPEEAFRTLGTAIGNHSVEFGEIKDFETLEVTVPNDGANTHTIRFRPQNKLLDLSGASYSLYEITKNGSQKKLESTGSMGKYDLYEVDGRQFTLSMSLIGGGHVLARYGAIALGCLIAVIVLGIFLIRLAKQHGYKIPETRRRLHGHVRERIASKERIFYDDKAAAKAAADVDGDARKDSKETEKSVKEAKKEAKAAKKTAKKKAKPRVSESSSDNKDEN